MHRCAGVRRADHGREVAVLEPGLASAAQSRGTTEPGTELPGEVSASKTRSLIGSTASNASAT
jgi:hypothetical protein